MSPTQPYMLSYKVMMNCFPAALWQQTLGNRFKMSRSVRLGLYTVLIKKLSCNHLNTIQYTVCSSLIDKELWCVKDLSSTFLE